MNFILVTFFNSTKNNTKEINNSNNGTIHANILDRSYTYKKV